ncbi:hypothetical protein HNY73_012470 [Argiope bruennichi]|uniref:Uncharacterized protein n=1 Tax=Argiope bruennichi TaxID=94029 RepID=A0A8T0EV07_ARGBR|nr:hypothetical protein HNY73_012470 [Argiope bruennichi]
MDEVCEHCVVRKFNNETNDVLLKYAKLDFGYYIIIIAFEQLSRFETLFVQNIHEYNLAFQTTSFGVDKIVQDQHGTIELQCLDL